MTEYSQEGYGQDPYQQTSYDPSQQQSYDQGGQQGQEQGQQEQDVTIDTEAYQTEEQPEASIDELVGAGWDQESEPSEDGDGGGGAYA